MFLIEIELAILNQQLEEASYNFPEARIDLNPIPRNDEDIQATRNLIQKMYGDFVVDNDHEPRISSESLLESLLAKWKKAMMEEGYEFPD